MKALGVLILLVLILLGAFVMANWSLLTAPTALSFIVFSLDGPLGIILLAMMLGLALLFILYIMSLRTSMFVTGRHHAKDLRAQRELADQAEASRLTELRAQLDREFEQLHAEIRDVRTQMTARGDSLEQALLKSLGETTNTLSAYVAEVDDKLNRALPRLAN
jgi:uncharacterized protein YlxW (UPF0749 family)